MAGAPSERREGVFRQTYRCVAKALLHLHAEVLGQLELVCCSVQATAHMTIWQWNAELRLLKLLPKFGSTRPLIGLELRIQVMLAVQFGRNEELRRPSTRLFLCHHVFVQAIVDSPGIDSIVLIAQPVFLYLQNLI